MEINKNANVQQIAVTQQDNTQEIPFSPDVKFLRGFSPTIEVEEVEGGFNVVITDAEHTETVFIASGGEVPEEQIIEVVNAYLAENPAQSGATAQQAEQIERNRVGIQALANALSDYAKKSEVPSIEGLASETYVQEYAQPVGDYLTEESDPTVPAWAKAPTKPSYTADEVGAEPVGAVSMHNVATDAHNDIRLLLEGLDARLTALADSDDDTLDQLSEVVAYIKANRELIESVTTTKVNVSDIIDNLTTNVGDRPLSAAQGVALKALIDAIVIPTNVSSFANDAGYLTEHQSLEAYALKSEIPSVFVVTSTPAASIGKDGDIALVIGG